MIDQDLKTEIDYCNKMGYHPNDEDSLRDLAHMFLQYKEYLIEKGEITVNAKLDQNNFQLSERQLEIVSLSYLTNQGIADKLYVSCFTINSHMQNIRRNTGLKNKFDMVRWATAIGLIKRDEQF